MTKQLSIVGIGISLLFCGCSSAGYKPSGFDYGSYSGKSGFSDSKLQDDLYAVTFESNVNTSPQQCTDFTLLRSAELTLENGHRYFAIVQEHDDTLHVNSTMPVTGSSTTGNASVQGNTLNYNETTSYYGGGTAFYTQPNQRYLIRTFKTKPKINGMVWDAAQLKTNLRAKYKLDK